jgi:hypothetical protein
VVTGLYCHLVGRKSVGGNRVNVRGSFKKKLHAVHFVALDGEVETRSPVPVALFEKEVPACIQNVTEAVPVAIQASAVQTCPTLGVHKVQICTVFY